MRRRFLGVVGAISLLGTLVMPCTSSASGVRDVPLVPWTFFALQRDRAYDALERLALSGLAGPVVLNTKPMSRREMARVVGRVVEKIQRGEEGGEGRRDLEGDIADLTEEFAAELALLGIRPFVQKEPSPSFFTVKPVDKLQVRSGYTVREAHPENRLGESLRRGFFHRGAVSSYLEAGDFLALYAHSELLQGFHELRGRLVEGYAKVRISNIEFLAGRESLWWGPGFHGSMLLSNNAAPLDQVRISSAEPFVLPWVLRYLGPIKMVFFLAQLEEERDFPRAKLAGMRLDLSPFPFLELGAARVVQFGGKGRPHLSAAEWPKAIFGGSDSGGDPTGKFNNNQILSFDMTWRFPNVERYLFIAKDMQIYGELGVDDTCCNNVLWPLKPGFLAGVYLPGFLGLRGNDLRFEYAQTISRLFTHNVYTTGYSLRGNVLSHFIGTQGEDIYVRATQRLSPDLMIGVEFDQARVGSTQSGRALGTKEVRRSAGIDISYRYTSPLWMFLAYRFERTENKDFVSGTIKDNHLVRLEVTYQF